MKSIAVYMIIVKWSVHSAVVLLEAADHPRALYLLCRCETVEALEPPRSYAEHVRLHPEHVCVGVFCENRVVHGAVEHGGWSMGVIVLFRRKAQINNIHSPEAAADAWGEHGAEGIGDGRAAFAKHSDPDDEIDMLG